MKRIARFLGLFMAIFSILLKEDITSMWDILLWVPITLGYAIWFKLDDFLEFFGFCSHNWKFVRTIKNSYNERDVCVCTKCGKRESVKVW